MISQAPLAPIFTPSHRTGTPTNHWESQVQLQGHDPSLAAGHTAAETWIKVSKIIGECFFPLYYWGTMIRYNKSIFKCLLLHFNVYFLLFMFLVPIFIFPLSSLFIFVCFVLLYSMMFMSSPDWFVLHWGGLCISPLAYSPTNIHWALLLYVFYHNVFIVQTNRLKR